MKCANVSAKIIPDRFIYIYAAYMYSIVRMPFGPYVCIYVRVIYRRSVAGAKHTPVQFTKPYINVTVL